MKYQTAIEVALATMHELIGEASHHATTAVEHARVEQTGAAVGAIASAERALQDALALQRAVIAIYQLNRSGASS
jgi:hypothetical protein